MHNDGNTYAIVMINKYLKSFKKCINRGTGKGDGAVRKRKGRETDYSSIEFELRYRHRMQRCK
jgi:hypothetical protein